jgi:tRNA A37 threonylcarbamoyladenosine dehydratase
LCFQRHSTASLAEVGTPKVTSCAEYFAAVAPWVEVDARIELFEKDKAAVLLEGKHFIWPQYGFKLNLTFSIGAQASLITLSIASTTSTQRFVSIDRK